MNGSLIYAQEKIYNAVYELATGPGDVRSRLRNALKYIMIIPEKSLPDEIQSDFRWIKYMLTKNNKLGGEANLYNTLKKMQNRSGVKIAKKIIFLEDKIQNIINDK